MYIKTGTYTHDDGECTLRIERDYEVAETGNVVAFVERWNVGGILQADTQALLTARLLLLDAAYTQQNINVGLYTTGGILTSHFLSAAADNNQYVRCLGVSYPVGEGAEYTTFRHYEAKIEAKYILSGFGAPGSASDLISYEENIAISGNNGPKQAYGEVISGDWPLFMLTTKTPVIIVQSGSAVGGTGYPIPPQPIDPSKILNPPSDYKISNGSPKVLFPTRREFPTTWAYTMTYMSNVPTPAPTIPS